MKAININLGENMSETMKLDLKQYMLEHVSIKELEGCGEITQRLAQVIPEKFWMLRHMKDSRKSIMLLTLPFDDQIRVLSYYLLTTMKVRNEQIKLLDGNAQYIEQCEGAIAVLKEIISDQSEILQGDEMWEECPRCGDTNRFIKNGFCISCTAFIDDDVQKTQTEKKEPCPTCQGRGEIEYEDGCHTHSNTCPDCGGTGSLRTHRIKQSPKLTEDEERKLDDMIEMQIEQKQIEEHEKDEHGSQES